MTKILESNVARKTTMHHASVSSKPAIQQTESSVLSVSSKPAMQLSKSNMQKSQTIPEKRKYHSESNIKKSSAAISSALSKKYVQRSHEQSGKQAITDDLIEQLRIHWDASSYCQQRPTILIATYDSIPLIVIEDAKSVVFFSDRRKYIYACVRSRLEVVDGKYYSLKKKPHFISSTKTTDTITKFVTEELISLLD